MTDIPKEVTDIFGTACSKCGSTGLHACPGVPMQPWTEQERQDAAAAVQRIHDRESDIEKIAKVLYCANADKVDDNGIEPWENLPKGVQQFYIRDVVKYEAYREAALNPAGKGAAIIQPGYAVIEPFTWDAMLVFPENGVEIPLKKRDDGRYEFDQRYGAKGVFRVTEEMIDRAAALSTSGRQDDPKYREKIRKILEAGYNVQ